MRSSTLLAVLAAIAAPVFAHPQAVPPIDRANQCYTPPPSKEFLAAAKAMAEEAASGPVARTTSTLIVNTYFHVLAQDTTEAGGYIPADKLAAQFAVLNNNYAPSGIQFKLLGTDYTINAAWANFNYFGNTPNIEKDFKTALHKGDYKTLNLYFHRTLTGLLGICNFPTDLQVDPGALILDGCSILGGTVPGGPVTNFNQGKTATHEVGHWFGLLHTFQGGSCSPNDQGDLISDTPQQLSPSSGCPVGRDSCPGSPGLDPINNYMDYSDDVCYTQFTAGQSKRALNMFKRFREGKKVCSADNCLRALRSTSVPGRLQQSQAFCKEFFKDIITDVTVLPKYAADSCTREAISQVSSACGCLPTV